MSIMNDIYPNILYWCDYVTATRLLRTCKFVYMVHVSESDMNMCLVRNMCIDNRRLCYSQWSEKFVSVPCMWFQKCCAGGKMNQLIALQQFVDKPIGGLLGLCH